MSRDKKSKKVTPSKRDFLDTLEENLKEQLDKVSSIEKSSTSNKVGSRRVTFGTRVHKRAFLKHKPAANFENDKEEDEEFSKGELVAEHEESEEESSEEMEKDSADDDSNNDSDDDSDNQIDFDSLSPAEQLRILMNPVDEKEEDEQSDEFEQSDEDEQSDEFGQNDEDEYTKEFETRANHSFDKEMAGKDFRKEDRSKNRSSSKSSEQDEGRYQKDDDDDVKKGKEPGIQSTFEKQQERLRKTISKLEEENVNEKPWMLKGEVSGKERPINSLLEEDIDFEHVGKTAPVITEQVTESLESIIKQRIKDRAWDDVERKIIVETSSTTRRKPMIELDMEKSSKSLSQVYEEEILSKVNSSSSSSLLDSNQHHDGDADGSGKSASSAPVDDTTRKAHQEISLLFKKICYKLDSLSNFKFSPRAYSLGEIQIKTRKLSTTTPP